MGCQFPWSLGNKTIKTILPIRCPKNGISLYGFTSYQRHWTFKFYLLAICIYIFDPFLMACSSLWPLFKTSASSPGVISWLSASSFILRSPHSGGRTFARMNEIDSCCALQAPKRPTPSSPLEYKLDSAMLGNVHW